MVREEVLNTELAGFLARGLANALRIPEESVKVVKPTGSFRRAPDIQILDLFGVRIVVQGKIDDLDAAIEDCKATITEGLADACFAASYPADLAAERDILAIRKKLESAQIDLALVTPPVQLTLTGWPEESIRRLGKLQPAGIVSLVSGESVYDEIVGTDLAEKLAESIGSVLNEASSLPPKVQESIAVKLADALAIKFEAKESGDDDPE